MRALLVHGMGRSPLSMVLLAARLRRAGMAPSLFGYVPAVQRFDAITTRLVARLTTLATDPEYLVVGHSLGGLLLRAALNKLDPSLPRPRHLFMLATPNHSPRLARRFQQNPVYRLYTGDAGQMLADPARVASIPAPSVPYTLVAGTRGRLGTRPPFGPEPNDWIVGVSEVRLREDDDVVTMPFAHTFLMNHRSIAELIVSRASSGGTEPET